jgi:hypothetical protein
MHLSTRLPLALALAAASLLGAPAHATVRPPFDFPGVAWCPPAGALGAQVPGDQTGEVVITEFMKDPSAVTDTNGEWIEIYNALPWRVNIEGWVLSDDGGSQHIIWKDGNGIRIASGKYFVLGNNADPATNGGIAVDYEYSGFSLGNGADQIMLTRWDESVVDRVAYDDGVQWPDAPGKSISLRLAARDALQNDDGANWCAASSALSATNSDTGTPDADNDACP